MNTLEKFAKLSTLYVDLCNFLDSHEYGELAPHALDELKLELIQLEETIKSNIENN